MDEQPEIQHEEVEIHDMLEGIEDIPQRGYDEIPKKYHPTLDAERVTPEELVTNRAGNGVRQAGSRETVDTTWVTDFKLTSEQNLFVFSKGVIGRAYLTEHLHQPVCDWFQKVPPFRKLGLLPRDHAKTSIAAHCLPPHIIIQPKENNIYIPGLPGVDNRIILTGETEGMAGRNLRTIQSIFEGNDVFRAFWPECTWPKFPPRDMKTGKKVPWNSQEMVVPRNETWPDSTVKAIGVGGAVTGSRPTILIKDDLISIAAANSETEMTNAIDWHIASRALMDEYEKDTGVEALEFIIGTRWAVFDLYQYIIDNDPTVETMVRAIVENGKPIWPERFNMDRVDQLRAEFGSLFFLLYMNSAADPELTDFDMTSVRKYHVIDGGRSIEFADETRDAMLGIKPDIGQAPMPDTNRRKLTPEMQKLMFGENRGRGEFLRLRYG